MQLEIYQIKQMLSDAAEVGVAHYVKTQKPSVDVMSQREAYRSFGAARVKDWEKRCLISRTRNGETKRTKILYSRAELLTAEKTDKLNKIINS